MIHHEPCVSKMTLIQLENSSNLLAKEVSERFDEFYKTFPKGYMKFAEGSRSTELYEAYNVFLCHYPGFTDLYRQIVTTIKSKIPNYQEYALAGWVNIYNKGGYLNWHKHGPENVVHDGRWHGYVAVNAEPSQTVYRDKDEIVKTIDNKDGHITLSPAGLYHRVSEWNKDQPRITIAFDIIRREQIDPLLLNRWIPIV